MWGKLVGLVFPHKTPIARFDTLSIDQLAQTAHTVHIRCLVSCIAPFPFTNALVRTAIHATKYHGHVRASSLLGQALAPFLAESLADLRMTGRFTTPLLIPMPIHTRRLRERGYNQSERIAKALIDELQDTQTSLAMNILLRIKNTKRQARKTNRNTRMSAVRGAFSVKKDTDVRNMDIILLDDVITTGATMREARDTLIHAGVREVLCVACAH